jgi:hypothetical protein
MKTYKIIIFSLLVFNLSAPLSVLGQTQIPNQPENLEEAKQLGEKAVEFTKKEGPGLMQKVWTDEALPIWKKMFEWVKTRFWDDWIGPWLKNIWAKSVSIFKGEVSERKPVVEEEFQKEKQELKKEAPEVGKTLWQKFQELIK